MSHLCSNKENIMANKLKILETVKQFKQILEPLLDFI